MSNFKNLTIMKLKNLFLGIFVSVLCVGFTACSSDDDDTDYAAGIEGTYQATGTNGNIIIEIVKDGNNQVKITTSAFDYTIPNFATYSISSVTGTATTSQGALWTNLSGTATATVLGVGTPTASLSGGINPELGSGTINIDAIGMTIPLIVTRVIAD